MISRNSSFSFPQSLACNLLIKDFSSYASEQELDLFCNEIQSRLDSSLQTVVCLFAWAGTPRSSADSNLNREFIVQNQNIVNNSIHLSIKICADQFIFLSSAGGIYSSKSSYPCLEESPVFPETPYGIQKLHSEQLFFSSFQNKNIKLCNLRVSCAYGFNDIFPDQGVLNKWIHDGLMYNNISIYNSLQSSLNFIGFEQVSAAMMLAIDYNLSSTFNVGSEKSTSLGDLLESLVSILPHLKFKTIGSTVRYLDVSTSKFKQYTNTVFDSRILIDLPLLFARIKSFLRT